MSDVYVGEKARARLRVLDANATRGDMDMLSGVFAPVRSVDNERLHSAAPFTSTLLPSPPCDPVTLSSNSSVCLSVCRVRFTPLTLVVSRGHDNALYGPVIRVAMHHQQLCRRLHFKGHRLNPSARPSPPVDPSVVTPTPQLPRIFLLRSPLAPAHLSTVMFPQLASAHVSLFNISPTPIAAACQRAMRTVFIEWWVWCATRMGLCCEVRSLVAACSERSHETPLAQFSDRTTRYRRRRETGSRFPLDWKPSTSPPSSLRIAGRRQLHKPRKPPARPV
ncbi:unnamed protein product [Pleuronectes platessa]|uniref:Uncharacterized protein n=1 Tax=Pleuronectes platessa TaxID=8262 RepID=A0A9N7VNB5_PLEPL|nr:unnamed protein product [Pleuronectes platessa]